ncbi:hypothetical protein BDZ90DRAFT_262040 [Jaminaea rosea]|uniref:Uncharacterized protein n=1 Tax=Jaminaea rosea TaxID=1569628 RepID=A0A316UKQ7_9BASI|nr:hypothetical protein BDZ90DRAFT_262040 [Jaminaea rosea]PWN25837.1 hypothetical protein BDZ90DRAFT_262040 [Jaminaea rosea]
MSWFSNQWDRLSKAWDGQGNQADPEAPIHDLEITWGRERLRLNLPPRSTLGSLRSAITHHTSVPPEQQKLIYHGLILRGDEATLLANYGLASGSRLVLVGSTTTGDRVGNKAYAASSSKRKGADGGARAMTKGEALAEEKKRKEEDRTEAGVTGRIKDVVDRTKKELEPQLRGFEEAVSGTNNVTPAAAATSEAPQTTSTATPTPTPTSTASAPQPAATPSVAPSTSLPHTHRYLNELLSRSLLDLDAIPAVSETTRALRKEAVRTVQGFIDRLDKAWEGVSEAERKADGRAKS